MQETSRILVVVVVRAIEVDCDSLACRAGSPNFVVEGFAGSTEISVVVVEESAKIF